MNSASTVSASSSWIDCKRKAHGSVTCPFNVCAKISYLDFIKIEWHVSRNRAIKSCFEESRPVVLELVMFALVVLADACHARVNALSKEKVRYYDNSALTITAIFHH